MNPTVWTAGWWDTSPEVLQKLNYKKAGQNFVCTFNHAISFYMASEKRCQCIAKARS